MENDVGRNGVEFGWGAPPMKEQHPVLPDAEAEQFDLDNAAMLRLRARGYLTDSQRDSVIKKIAKSIGTEIRKALSAK